MKFFTLVTIAVIACNFSLDARADSAKEACIKSAMATTASCQQKLPPVVTPADHKKPTDSEKSAMLARTKAETACNEAAKNEMAKCK